ncbi:MAG: hypothetical protein M3N43_01385, partial [Actinomycetota bacterium]|nr:hypothetical protein [Actinomycetota bacterium]
LTTTVPPAVGIVFTCQLEAALDDVDPGVGAVVTVVGSESGPVVDVVAVDDEVEDRSVDAVVVGAARGVNGPGLTCSPAAATICQARTVVSVVAATQIATRPKRFTSGFSQGSTCYRIKGTSRFSQAVAYPKGHR